MLVGFYFVKVIVGNQGVPGAPLLHFAGVVDESTSAVTGHAQINQAVPAPDNEIHISPVTGHVRHLGYGHDKRIVTLSGTYTVPLGPPPLIGERLEHFHAVLDLQPKGDWEGEGSFNYGNNKVDNVPVVTE